MGIAEFRLVITEDPQKEHLIAEIFPGLSGNSLVNAHHFLIESINVGIFQNSAGPALFQLEDQAAELIGEIRIDEETDVIANGFLHRSLLPVIKISPDHLVHIVVDSLGIGDGAHHITLMVIVDLTERAGAGVGGLSS